MSDAHPPQVAVWEPPPYPHEFTPDQRILCYWEAVGARMFPTSTDGWYRVLDYALDAGKKRVAAWESAVGTPSCETDENEPRLPYKD